MAMRFVVRETLAFGLKLRICMTSMQDFSKSNMIDQVILVNFYGHPKPKFSSKCFCLYTKSLSHPLVTSPVFLRLLSESAVALSI